jgi:hypothetical protein
MPVNARPGVIIDRVAGLVTLVGEDRQSIESDIDTLRLLVSDGIFGSGGEHSFLAIGERPSSSML